MSALLSNSNTVGLNIQMYMYICLMLTIFVDDHKKIKIDWNIIMTTQIKTYESILITISLIYEYSEADLL